jgi:hypothetical protein
MSVAEVFVILIIPLIFRSLPLPPSQDGSEQQDGGGNDEQDNGNAIEDGDAFGRVSVGMLNNSQMKRTCFPEKTMMLAVFIPQNTPPSTNLSLSTPTLFFGYLC